MKKTISINISGINFHIDEDAYEKLNRYLEAIGSHFKGIEGSDEVMGDIESRISEILQAKISESKQVINMEDVDEIIRIMGQPSDFAPDGETSASEQEQPYILNRKRLYRDPEHKLLGGVCSGIGAYFNLDPLWVRLIFILLVFAPGFGILLYIILWLVVPEARTAAEKLEMRGQPVTISTLEHSFRQEVGDIKEKVNEMAGKARETYQHKKESFDEHRRSYINDNLRSIGHFFLRVLGIFTGVIIFLLAASLSVLFLFIIFRFPGITVAEHVEIGIFPLFPFLSMLFENDADLRTLSIGLIVLTGIPLLLLMLAGLRMIFRIPSIRYLNGAAGWVWLLTLIITLYFGFKVAGSFRQEGESTREQLIRIPGGDTLNLAVIRNLPDDPAWNIRRSYMVPEWGIYLTDYSKGIYGIPRLKISESPDTSIYLSGKFYSRGSSRSDASERADNIEYEWSLDSNRLSLPESFRIPPGEQWRKQEVAIELKLPEGCIFRTDEKLGQMNIRGKGLSSHKMGNKVLIMTNEGVHEFTP